MHNQVLLERNGSKQTVWIPSEFATENRVIDLKVNRVWDRGWTVTQVFQPAMASETVRGNSDNYKNHRKATDI